MLEKPRKSDQDKLDACLCLLVAIHYAEAEALMVGDTGSGYIVVPYHDDLYRELCTRCSAVGRQAEEWVRTFSLGKAMNSATETTMTRPWQQMTTAERIADRIAKNREIEREAVKSPAYWTVDRIAERLNERGQRATYGAVAGVAGGLARGVMQGRAMSPIFSWIVTVKGQPSGYSEKQIDPKCLRQIRERNGNIIRDGDDLRRWLDS